MLRTNSTNRIRIHDYGATSFDTYGAVTTTPTARLHQHQIFTMSCTAAASGTAKAMVNVGNTNAFDYTIVARIDSKALFGNSRLLETFQQGYIYAFHFLRALLLFYMIFIFVLILPFDFTRVS